MEQMMKKLFERSFLSCYCGFAGLEITMNGIKSPPVYTTSWADGGGLNITGRLPSETQRAAPASVN